MLNAKNLNVKLNAQIKDVKCLTAQNALQFAKLHTVLLIAKHLNPSVRPYVKSLSAIGNVINPLAQNPNAS
jgi:hypothetical protein